MTETVITIPYHPRLQQATIHEGMSTHRWGVTVCHRRMGKTVAAINHLQRSALTCQKDRPRFAYIAPTYKQGKAIAWDYMEHYARPIPGAATNTTELRVDYPNGGQVRIYGADNPDSLRGIYLDGAVFDEYGLHPPNIFTEVVRPLLADRQGWALFLGTPAGKNQFYDTLQKAQSDPAWFCAIFRASQTGLLDADELRSARSTMTQDEYDQEFECSFEASVKGAVFAAELQAAREAGRVCRVPYDPALLVDTDWDLGVGDATSIWFSQSSPGGEVRVIDYYESSGEGLPHYVSVLQQRGYTYGRHWAPHDIEVRELSSGHSRRDIAAGLGVNFLVVPNLSLNEGIHAARMLLPRCWFDAEKTQHGRDCLMHYRWDWNTRISEFKSLPVHDWASHGADAFRYLAVRHQTPKVKRIVNGQKDHDEWDRRPAAVRRGGY